MSSASRIGSSQAVQVTATPSRRTKQWHALTAPLVEGPLAATAFIEDVEAVRAAWQRREHGLLTASAEGALPAGGAAVRAGAVAALVLAAAELADA